MCRFTLIPYKIDNYFGIAGFASREERREKREMLRMRKAAMPRENVKVILSVTWPHSPRRSRNHRGLATLSRIRLPNGPILI